MFPWQPKSNIIIYLHQFQAEADVEQFLKETHTFDEYKKEVEKFHRLVEEITYNSIKVNNS